MIEFDVYQVGWSTQHREGRFVGNGTQAHLDFGLTDFDVHGGIHCISLWWRQRTDAHTTTSDDSTDAYPSAHCHPGQHTNQYTGEHADQHANW
jgi:hypothetical protein